MNKPHVTVFINGNEPFIAMHINGYLSGLWRGGGIQASGEVLKELVNANLATLTVIGDKAQSFWNNIITCSQVLPNL